MEIMFFLVLSACLLLIAVLLIKLHLLRKSIEDLGQHFSEKLKTDTNTLLDVSSRDPYLLSLADQLNDQLCLLQEERHRFLLGDQKLQEQIADISHDLRTPLTAIIGYLDLLEKEELSKDAARYLSVIRNRTDILKELIEELFCYSVLTSPTKPLSREQVSLNSVLEESIAAFYLSLTSAGISPCIELPKKTVYRSLNRPALERIFENFLANAVKYSDGDLTIRLFPSGEILFSNHTTALNALQLEQLFHRFYTVETAEKSTGLGLSIAKELTERMGGKLKFSYENTLLCIRLWFPEKERTDFS